MGNERRPLFARYPGTRSVPWTRLAALPTPVVRNDVLAQSARAKSLWVKRDDLTGAHYGGNKVRKLEFLVAGALAEGATDAITFGAVGSNHALATAIYGTAAGLEVHSMLMPQPNAAYVRRNLLASEAAGADLRYFEDKRAALLGAGRLRDELVSTGRRCAVIPFGGTTAVSTLGFVNAGLELAEQVEAGVLPEPDTVFVALGSMGTAAGLAIGMRAAGLRTRVAAVPILTDDTTIEPDLMRVVGETCALLESLDASFPKLRWSSSDVDVVRGFLGDGYACRTEAGMRAVDVMDRAAGIGLETTYTGKALAALLDRGAAGALAGRDVVFWDTYNSRDLSPLVEAADARALVPELLAYVTGNV